MAQLAVWREVAMLDFDDDRPAGVDRRPDFPHGGFAHVAWHLIVPSDRIARLCALFDRVLFATVPEGSRHRHALLTRRFIAWRAKAARSRSRQSSRTRSRCRSPTTGIPDIILGMEKPDYKRETTAPDRVEIPLDGTRMRLVLQLHGLRECARDVVRCLDNKRC